MFVDECVRSRFFGLGRVTIGGLDPTVLFLCGKKSRVPGDTLRVISHLEYEAEVLNRDLLEAYLDWRIHGVSRTTLPVLANRFDWTTATDRDIRPANATGRESGDLDASFFIFDDLNRGSLSESVTRDGEECNP